MVFGFRYFRQYEVVDWRERSLFRRSVGDPKFRGEVERRPPDG
jgi:hypothetical protein